MPGLQNSSFPVFRLVTFPVGRNKDAQQAFEEPKRGNQGSGGVCLSLAGPDNSASVVFIAAVQ